MFRNELHNACTKKINKIAPSANDDQIIRALDGVTTCSYGYEF